LGFEVTRDGEENAIAVDDFSCFADEEGAVGIAIESHAELSALGEHALLQAVEMKRSAAGVDVAAIGRDTHRDDFGTERMKEFGAEFERGTIGAVKDDAETGELGAMNDAAAEKIEIFGVERGIGD
jgi:hypothetical protein